jgi:hypothetical protein
MALAEPPYIRHFLVLRARDTGAVVQLPAPEKKSHDRGA